MAMSTGEKTSRSSLSEINVTPLVDVMLVLLIIFMITAPMMQQGLEVELPETANSGVSTNEEPFVLVIKENRKIYAGTAEIALKSLGTKIQSIFETRKSKQIYIQADKKVDYGIVAEAMGELKAAGIQSVGLITIPKNQ